MNVVRVVPRTKLREWLGLAGGFDIVLECECGAAVEYPGHPDSRTTVQCEGCLTLWTIKADAPERIADALQEHADEIAAADRAQDANHHRGEP